MTATKNVPATKKFVCTVRQDDKVLKVTSPEGTKTLELNLDAVTVANKKGTVTKEEGILVRDVCQAMRIGETRDYTFTHAQLVALTALRDRLNRQAKTAKNADATNDRMLGVLNRKVAGNGETAEAQRVDRLKKIAARMKGRRYVLLTYDIPSHLDKECPNPSWELRPLASRFNKSCWIVPEENAGHPTITALMDHWAKFPEVEPFLLPQDPNQGEALWLKAVKNLDDTIRELHESLITRLANADKWLAEWEEASHKCSLERAETVRNNKVRSTLRDVGEKMAALVACAEQFDLTMDDAVLTSKLVVGLKADLAKQTAEFNERMRQIDCNLTVAEAK